MVGPRIMSVPAGGGDLGKQAVELAKSAGLVLDDWQALVLERSLGVRASGKWGAFEVGVNVPRQNGKGAILEARELAGLFLLGEELIIHSAHEFATSQEHFRRLETLIRNTPELHEQVKGRGRSTGYKHSHGEEGIELVDGRRIIFKTRTKGGGRGLTCDCLVLDEAMVISDAAIGATMPTLRARTQITEHGVQVWYAGSAVDQEIHEHGVVWARIRERGMAGEDPSLAYFEWSADVENVALLSEQMAEDPALRLQSNPSLGVRIDPEHMEREYRSMDLRTFGVELLGVGDYPRTDGLADTVIPLAVWDDLTDLDSHLLEIAAAAIDVSPDRRSSVALAGRRADGLLGVEIHENRAGTSWLPETLAALVEARDVPLVKGDGYGPAASVIHAIEEAGVKVETVTAGEHSQACGRLVDLVADRAVRHAGTGELRAAIRGARTRPLGDAWAWSRKTSSVDISPLVAATLALSAAMDTDSGEVVIW